MSNSNKKAKEELIRLYGAECFIERLHLRPEESKVYTGSQLKYMRKHQHQLKQLTYHHIKERSQGGKATVENGALLSEGNHRWFNQQSKENQAKMNEAFQELKRRIDNARECKIELVDTLDIGVNIKFAEISFSEEIKPPKEKFNRAKVKQETRKKIKEWEERKMKITQKQRIINYIKDFGSITSFQAYADLGITQLGARIDGLEKEGYVFKKEKDRGKNRYGEPVHFTRYSFIEQDKELMKHIPSII